LEPCVSSGRLIDVAFYNGYIQIPFLDTWAESAFQST